MRAARRPSGFTLIELVLVLIVMGILSAVAAPRLVSWQTMDQQGFRDDLRAMLRHAHKVAVSQNRDTCVVLTGAIPTSQAVAVYASGGSCNMATPLDDPGAGNSASYCTGTAYCLQVPTGLTLTNTTVYFSKRTGALWPSTLSTQGINIGSLPAPALTVFSDTGFVSCNTGTASVC